jgi:hypothetical protein
MFTELQKRSADRGPKYRIPIEKLYPDLAEDDRAEAEYFLTRYLEIVYRILEEG